MEEKEAELARAQERVTEIEYDLFMNHWRPKYMTAFQDALKDKVLDLFNGEVRFCYDPATLTYWGEMLRVPHLVQLPESLYTPEKRDDQRKKINAIRLVIHPDKNPEQTEKAHEAMCALERLLMERGSLAQIEGLFLLCQSPGDSFAKICEFLLPPNPLPEMTDIQLKRKQVDNMKQSTWFRWQLPNCHLHAHWIDRTVWQEKLNQYVIRLEEENEQLRLSTEFEQMRTADLHWWRYPARRP